MKNKYIFFKKKLSFVCAWRSLLLNRWAKTGVFVIVLSIGFFLRLWKYQYYPFTGHAEEYLFVWSGLSLIEEGVPISWNDIPVYGENNVYWRGVAPNPGPSGGGIGVRLIKPWLDEPPLFSLIVGGIAKLYKQPNFTVISPLVIRLPSLFFSLVTMILTFLVAKKLFGYGLGVISLLIYATIPTVVFGSRLAVPENLIAMLSLLILWLYLKYFERWKIRYLILSIFLASIAGLAKPTGYLLVFFLFFLLIWRKRWQEGIISLICGSLIFLASFFAYGHLWDWSLFLKVFLYQSSRPAGWSSLAYILTNPGFSVEIFLDGMIVLGFLSLWSLAFKKDRSEGEEIVVFSFIFTLLIAVISGGKHDQLTWYRYPIYPFMAISLALLIKEIINNPSFFQIAIFVPLSLANIDLLENPFWKLNYLVQSKVFRPVLFIFLLPSILLMIFKDERLIKLTKAMIVVCLLFSFIFNIWVVVNRFNILCNNTSCPLPEKINLLKIFR